MKVAAITLTYNRLELTKKTVESFYAKTSVDFHLFVDNCSTDGTQEWLKSKYHLELDRNYGIAYAFVLGVSAIEQRGFDFILKLDNDVETITEGIVSKMLDFHKKAGMNYVTSPTDLLLDPNFAPHSFRKEVIHGYKVDFVSHTGGAFQLIPIHICKLLCAEFRQFQKGDYAIGPYYQKNGYSPVYLRDLEMKHIGLNMSTPKKEYVF